MTVPIIGDGETVRLLLNLPNEGEHRLIGLNADLHPLRRHQGTGAVAVVLYHAENGDGQTEALGHLQRGFGVDLAAVDQKDIR